MISEIPADHSNLEALQTENRKLRATLAKRDWLLDLIEWHRSLSSKNQVIERRVNLSSEEFFECYYTQNRPVILSGEMSHWPAVLEWNPDAIKAKVGSLPVQFQGNRDADPHHELQKVAHSRELPFDQFIDQITSSAASNNAYLTAYNSERNEQAMSRLHPDLGTLDRFLDHKQQHSNGMMWIGPRGTFTPLHHDLTNNLLAQIMGRKKIKMIPPSEVGKLYNKRHVFSEMGGDLDLSKESFTDYPLLGQIRCIDVGLMPGELLFIPVGWWHQVRSLDFSVTITYTNFIWENSPYSDYPPDAA